MFKPAFLWLKDVGPFKDQKFTFSEGITTIYGLNLGAGNSVTNTNAAGKSALFSSIYETLFETPLSNIKSDKVKPGKHTLGFYVGDQKYTLIRKGSSAELRDGQKTYTGVMRVRRKLQEILPILPEDYTTFIHLDSQLSHPLVKGTNAQRKAFFTAFFDQVMDLDEERAKIKDAIANITKQCESSLDIKTKIAELEPLVLSDDQILLLRQELRQLKQEYNTLQQSSLQAKKYQEYNEFKAKYSKVIPLIKGDLESAISKFERIVHSLDQLEKDYAKYKASLEAKTHYEEWLKSIPKELQGLISNGFYRRSDFQKSIEEAARLELRINQIEHELRQPIPEPPPKGVKCNLVDVQRRVDQLEATLHHRHDGSICPECGQKTVVRTAEELRQTKKKLANLKAQLVDGKLYDKWVAYNKELAQLTKRRESLQSELEECKRRYKQADKYRRYSELLDGMPPEPIKAPKVDYDRMRHKKATSILDQLLEIRELDYIPESTQSVRFDSVRFEAIIKRKLQIQDLLRNAKTSSAKLEELKIAYHKTKLLLDRKEKLQQLITAYDDKAVKRMVIEAISEQLMVIVNNESHNISGEDFRFGFEWHSNQVALTVQRFFNGKPTEPTDVRLLSGAESKLYTLTLMMALLHFVPSNRRSSVLILDEPNAHFGEDSERRFRSLLQKLQTVIPSIVIITPRLDRYGGKELTVLKKNGKATIVSGHPSDLQ